MEIRSQIRDQRNKQMNNCVQNLMTYDHIPVIGHSPMRVEITELDESKTNQYCNKDISKKKAP